jgi:hypothetical protein
LSASGDLGFPEELRAMRKPRKSLRSPGEYPCRYADLQIAAV